MGLKNLWCLYNERKEIRFLIHQIKSYPFQIPWFVTLSSQQRIHYEVKAILLKCILLNYGKKVTIKLPKVKTEILSMHVCACMCVHLHICTNVCKNKHRCEAKSIVWILFPENKPSCVSIISVKPNHFSKMDIIIVFLLCFSN